MLVATETILWRRRFPTANIDGFTLGKIQETRPTFERLAQQNRRGLWWVHWARDKVKAEIASAGGASDAASKTLETITDMFVTGFFDDDVDAMVSARGQGSTHAISTLASTPSLNRAVTGQSARLSD